MERDCKLFKYLFENKIATRDQIARDVFKSVGKQVINDRLLKLTKAKYIESSPIVWHKKILFTYELCQNGVQILKRHYPYHITGRGHKSNSIKHDLSLVDLRFAFQRMGLVTNYFTEAMLQSCTEFEDSEDLCQFVAVNSDAVIEVTTTKRVYYFAIEYEASDKAKDRYYKKLTDYHTSGKIPAVLFICKHKAIMKLVKSIEKDICSQGFNRIIYFSMLGNVLNTTGRMQLFNVENKLFELE